MTTKKPVKYIRTFDQLLVLANQGRKLREAGRAAAIPERVRLARNLLVELSDADLKKAIDALFDGVLSGFSTKNKCSDEGNKRAKRTLRQLWEFIAARGFTDHVSDFMDTWYKPRCLVRQAPKLDFAYTKPANPRKWDTNAVYSHVLGSAPDAFNELAETPFFKSLGITHVVEPLAASGEFCYFGHFSNPELTYSMLDLDQSAKERTLAREWLPGTKHEYVLGDVLKAATWDKLKLIKGSKGKSICFIGKQSHNLFDNASMVKLLDMCLTYCDYLFIETLECDASLFRYTSQERNTWEITPVHLLNTSVQVFMQTKTDPASAFNRVSMESNVRVFVSDKAKPEVPLLDVLTYDHWGSYSPSTLITLFEGALGVKRNNVFFSYNASTDFRPVSEYRKWEKETGGIKDKDAGAFINLLVTRNV